MSSAKVHQERCAFSDRITKLTLIGSNPGFTELLITVALLFFQPVCGISGNEIYAAPINADSTGIVIGGFYTPHCSVRTVSQIGTRK